MIAKCENCGAALRIQEGTQSAKCEYCGVTSVVGTPSAGAEAPQLRIDPAPPVSYVDPEVMLKGYAMTPVGAVMIVAGLIMAVTGDLEGLILLGVGIVVGGVGTYFMRITAQEKRREREHQWFRDNGIPGRATVERIRAGQTRAATLGLKIELTARGESQLDHDARIPELLVPRLVQGLTVPVIVHPDDPTRIELQWHLL